MNVFGYGSQAVQHNQTMIATSNSGGPVSGAANFDDAMSGKMGKPLNTSSSSCLLGLQQMWRNFEKFLVTLCLEKNFALFRLLLNDYYSLLSLYFL